MRNVSRKYQAKQKLSRKRISKKRYSNKKTGGSVEQPSQSLLDITVGKCGKLGLFGRSGCVELKSKNHDGISIQKKVALYVNKHKVFQVRFFDNPENNKYTKKEITVDNYTDIITEIIVYLYPDIKITVSEVSEVIDQLVAYIKLNKKEIYNKEYMLSMLHSFALDIQNKVSNLMKNETLDDTDTDTHLRNFSKCLENLHTSEIVTIKDGKCILSEPDFSKPDSRFSSVDLQLYKNQKISQAKECVNNEWEKCKDEDRCFHLKTITHKRIKKYAENDDVIKINGNDVSIHECTL
jgi:hypothetical protein